MKRVLLFLLISLFLTNLGFSQSRKFYIRLGLEASGKISSNLNLLYNYSFNGTNRSISPVALGLGRGFTGIVAFGYRPVKYLSIELGVSEFLGFPNIADSVASLPGGISIEGKVQGNMLSLVPAVVISPGFKHVDPYARIGVIIGIRPTINSWSETTQGGVYQADEIKMVKHFYGGASAGLHAGIGVRWIVNALISLYAEFNFNSLNYSPKYSEVTKYEKNGQDALNTLTVKQTKTEFHKSIDPDEQIPDTSPNKELRKSIPFSNAGAMIGLNFHL